MSEILKQNKSGWEGIEEELKSKIFEFSKQYIEFLNKSKTEREIVTNAENLAIASGFKHLDEYTELHAGDKVYYKNRDKNLYLAVIGSQDIEAGINIIGAHGDSPRLDLKPNPLYQKGDFSYFNTHYYGGIKKYQWTTIPLSLHGRIVKKDGSYVDIIIGEDKEDPCFCVTDLLPHLAKEQMNKKMSEVITGEDLNVLVGSRPFKSDSGSELVKLNILKILNEKYGIVEEDLISADLELVPAMKAQDIGFDRSMIGGYAHDDRSCSYCCLEGILSLKEIPEETVIVLLTDKEETGSDGNTGMKSFFLKYFIGDLANQEGLKTRDVLSKSKCLSADVNAAYDPTYSSSFEVLNSSFINRGVVVTKYTGSGGKYSTSDASAEFTGEILRILDNNNVLWQSSELGKIDAGGGGTIAKYIASWNINVIDIGVPVISMHAPYEIISKIDLYMTYKAINSFFKVK